MAAEMDAVDHRDVHFLLIVLAVWTVLSLPSSVLVGRRLAARPIEVRVRQR
jgi:hypothetical protein